MTEHELQVACAEFLDTCLPDYAAWNHCPNEGKRSKRVGARLKREGLKPGWPDIEVIYRGRSIFIELKAAGKYPSKVQRDIHTLLKMAGCPVMTCCRSIDTMVEFLKLFIPLKGRIAA